MSSINVAGGFPIRPLHSRRLSQSPVWQAGAQVRFGFLGLKLQPVRAQRRPLQSHGAWMTNDWSGLRQKPPLAMTGWPVLGAVAGHIVNGHLLVITIGTVCPATPETQAK